ncbi:hypothetical protein AX15_005365 [Amanita polypyramis BW_CC]|nr:hypothetical protein AX15_005365 [Amanita polypyramis BW_CC]
MPVLRRPLRERRNVQLKVVTSSKDNDIKSTNSQIKHHYSKAKAHVRGGRRLRLNNDPGKLAPGARPAYVPQSIASENEPEAQKRAVTEQVRPKSNAAPAPLSRELNLDLDYDVGLENHDPFSAPTLIQGYFTPSPDPSSPSFLQDVFSLPQNGYSEADDFSLAYKDPSIYSTGEEDLQSMHEFLPFLFIALSDGQYSPVSLKASYGIDFTHIVKIVYPSLINGDTPGSISTSVNSKTGVQTLILTISPPHSHSRSSSASSTYGNSTNTTPPHRRVKGRRHARTGVSQRMYTLLTEEQLLTVRDFLSLALPYYLEAKPTTKKVASENVAVLLTAPGSSKAAYGMDGFGSNGYGYQGHGDDGSDKGSAADIISAIACYLSFASETPVDTVLAYIDEEAYLGDEWKDTLSRDEDGAGFVQKVAAM